jgi:para-nitrobenzyl esterase
MPRYIHSLALLLAVACAPLPVDSAPVETRTAGLGWRAQAFTDAGAVVGQATLAGFEFLGIPYAAPPVGSLRWRPPAPPAPFAAPWSALAVGPSCPQPGAREASEDCLYLNVYSPTLDSAARLPVMVFIHGGSFVTGSGGINLYDGAALVRQQQVVVVTINYRLGQLGFLAHPALSAQDPHGSSGNYGLLDQQAALRWVARNAAAFGGDAGNVTVWGESAGATSVCAHLVSPLAAGLFQRAIAESGNCAGLTRPLVGDDPVLGLSGGFATGIALANAAGCGGDADAAACLRARSPEQLMAALPASIDGTHGGVFSPVVDGWVLPESGPSALAAGRFAAVPLLTGVNRDEGTLFAAAFGIVTAADYAAALRALLPSHATEVLALYPVSRYRSPRDAFAAFATDYAFACPARALVATVAARQQHTYLYEFTRLNTLGVLLGLGVFHASELPYVFGNFVPPFWEWPVDRSLSQAMMGYWARFARSGDPGGWAASAWPPVGPAADTWLTLGDRVQPEQLPSLPVCQVFARWQEG